MITILQNSHEYGMCCKKIAESKRDRKILKRILHNINFLKDTANELKPEIYEYKENELCYEAFEGETYNSIEADEIYNKEGWIVEKIIEKVGLLSKNQTLPEKEIIYRFYLLKRLMRGFKETELCKAAIFKALKDIIFDNKKYVLSHGDLTGWNIVIQYEDKDIKIIDWEELGGRPRYFDEMHLALHKVNNIYDLGWQKRLIKNIISKRKDKDHWKDYLRKMMILCTCLHIRNNARNTRNMKIRNKILMTRLSNIKILTDKKSYEQWIEWISR